MPHVACIHPDCAARMPRRVNFCPACGAAQSVQERAPLPVQRPRPASIPVPAKAQPPASPPAKPERRTGIGFWIVALAVVFSFWLSFSDDKKPAPSGKLRHNASQDQRK